MKGEHNYGFCRSDNDDDKDDDGGDGNDYMSSINFEKECNFCFKVGSSRTLPVVGRLPQKISLTGLHIVTDAMANIFFFSRTKCLYSKNVVGEEKLPRRSHD